MMNEIHSFGVWVRRQRKALDLTQVELAELIGCTTSMLRKIETEERRPSVQLALQLARVLGLAPAERDLFLQAARTSTAVELMPAPSPFPGGEITPVPSPNAPHQAPVPSTLDAQLAKLPYHLSKLVGRERDIGHILGLLQSDKRLVTLTGLGGVGKTRLALQVVMECAGTYRDGVWFVDLAPARTVQEFLSRVAQTLEIAESPEETLPGRILARLRDRHLLVVLDNLEQIPDAPVPITTWLRAATELKLLVTSRFALDIPGEQIYPVQPLPSPNLQSMPPVDQLEQYGAIQLFVLRARDVQPLFELTPANARDVAEICRRLDGLPLAIELAAVWLRVFSPKQLLSQLHTRGALQVLRHEARDIPKRQQTMRATLAWSYALLQPPQQRLLKRVAVFASSWTIDMAERICADPEQASPEIGGEAILQLLLTLTQHMLIHPVRQVALRPRFRLLGAIREFALEQLQASGEEDAIRRQHALTYLDLVARTRQSYDAGDVDAFRPIHEEIDNVRAALDWALAHDMIVEAAETVVCLEPFWAGRAPVTLYWLEALVSHADVLPDILQAQVLALTALLSWEMFRDPVRSRVLCEKSLALYRAANERAGIATVLSGLAQVAISMGEVHQPQTEAYIAESLAIRRSMGDDDCIAETLTYHGMLVALQGKFEQARSLMGEALALRRARGRPLGIAVALAYLSRLAYWQGEFDELEMMTDERLALEQAMGNPQGIADCRLWLGVVALWKNDIVKATTLLESSLERLRALGEPRNTLHVLDTCAHAAYAAGDREAARAYQAERIALLNMLGAPRGTPWSHLHIGLMALDHGDLAQGLTSMRIAHSLFTTVGKRYGPTHLFSDLAPRRDIAGMVLLIEGGALLALRRGNAPKATTLLGAASKLRDAEGVIFYFPEELVRRDCIEHDTRSMLGVEAFERAFAAGGTLSTAAAIAEALETTPLLRV